MKDKWQQVQILSEDILNYINKKYREKINAAKDKEYVPKEGDNRSSEEIKKDRINKIGARRNELWDKAFDARANATKQAYSDAQKRGLKRTEETDADYEGRMDGFNALDKNEKGRRKNIEHNYEPGDYRSKKLPYNKFIEATKKSHPERAGWGKPKKEAIAASIERHNKKVNKMNDNNSYNEVLSQIMDLKEQFDSLFEVDGLGDPAVDVPPSQNKIKRDRKTKDGKVEVVSVEDELFPYEGNKREQFRQKIIDTINNMIQGTATLEDLLQLVRQKKAPLKEAMEILEEEIKKERKNNKQQVYKRLDDPEKNKINVKKYYNRVIHNDSESGDNANDYVKIKGTKYSVDKYGQIGAPLKEALDLMEAIINEVSDKTVEKALNHAGDKVELSTMGVLPPEKKCVDQYKKLQDLADKRAKKHGERIEQDPDTGWHKHIKEALGLMEAIINELNVETVKNALDKRTDQSIEADDKDREEFNKIMQMKDRSKRAQAYQEYEKNVNDRFNKENKKLDVYAKWAKSHPELVEALEIMETALDAIEKSDKSDEVKKILRNKLSKARGAERRLADEKAWKSWAKGDLKNPDVDVIRDSEFTKNGNGARKTRIRSGHYDKMGNSKIKPEWKQVEDSIKRHEKKSALKEAMEVLEELLGESRTLEDNIIKAYEAGRIDRQKMAKLVSKAHDLPSSDSYFHKSKGEKGERATKLRHDHYNYDFNKNGWSLGKSDDEKIEASIKRHEKKNALKEAIEVLENLQDQIDKKFKKGEINLDKAFELDKKIESKMSQEKNNQEREDQIQKEAKKKPSIERAAQQRQIAKSIRRNQRKNALFTEALELTEAIINEVSVGALARATENNAAKRKEVAKKSEEQAHKAWDSYEKLSQEHPEDEPALYNAATKLGKVAYKDEQRKEHVEDLEKLNLPKDSKVSANKLFKAADKSYDKRADEYDKLLDSEHPGKSYKETKESRPAKRYTRAARIGFAEPVKSRAHESLEKAVAEAEQLMELFDRPDLLNDIDTTLGSPVKKALKSLEGKIEAKLMNSKKEKKENK